MKAIYCFAAGLSALLLLCCTACGGQPKEAAAGLLSLEEIEELEDSYWLSKEELLKKLSLKDTDVKRWEENLGILEFSGQRTMGSFSFTPICNFAFRGEPQGLYLLRFEATFEPDQGETVLEAYNELSQEAVELYGEPDQGPVGNSENNSTFMRWKIGTQSSVQLTYQEPETEAEEIAVFVIYRLVVPGSIHDF